jgi:hypothetical protein
MAIVRPIEGHAMEIIPTASGRRFRLVCSCGAFGRGVNSPTQATERESVRKGWYHLQKVEAEFKRNAVPVPYAEGPPQRHTA